MNDGSSENITMHGSKKNFKGGGQLFEFANESEAYFW